MTARQFQMLADSIPQLVWMAKPDGHIIWFNRRWYDYTGKTPEQALGWAWQSVHDPLELPNVLKQWRGSIATGEPFEMVFPLRSKDGVFRPFLTRGLPIKDGEGKVERWFGTNTDITEHKRTEAELRKSHERIAIAAQAAGQGFWDFDIVANTLQWDAQMFRLYGRTVLEGAQPYVLWANSLHPDDRERSERELREAIDGTRELDTDFRIVLPDGRVRQLKSLGRVIRDNEGHAAQMFGLNFDITERRDADSATARALQRLNEAQRVGQIGDWEYDLASEAITWSAQVFEIFGRDPRLGAPSFDENEAMYDAASREVQAENVARVVESGEAHEYELLAPRADGDWVHVQTRALPRKDEAGRVVGLYGTIQNVSERKRLERRLRLMVNELNHRVKNTLAVVQAIASQTLLDTDPVLYESFEDRLSSLSAAHGVLTRESWTGADLHEVIVGQLVPYGGAVGGRFRLVGPNVRLSARAILSFALVVHELAINALKYGALSNERGQVLIDWEITSGPEPMLRLTWIERRGPRVRLPMTRGFGSQLIEHSLEGDLGAAVSLKFDDPRGISCVIETPLAQIAALADAWPLPQTGGALLEVSK